MKVETGVCFVELYGAVMRSHDSSRQCAFELVEEYGRVAQWLVTSGAKDELHRNHRRLHGTNWSPLHLACIQGQLHVVKWFTALEEEPMDELIRRNYLQEPITKLPIRDEYSLQYTFHIAHKKVTPWLIMIGAANTNEGHIDEMVIRQKCKSLGVEETTALSGELSSVVDSANSFDVFMSGVTAEKDHLGFLRGHEEGVCRLVAEFVGVAYGQNLQNAQEALIACRKVSFDRGKHGKHIKKDVWLQFTMAGILALCIVLEKYTLFLFIGSLFLMGFSLLMLLGLLILQYFLWSGYYTTTGPIRYPFVGGH